MASVNHARGPSWSKRQGGRPVRIVVAHNAPSIRPEVTDLALMRHLALGGSLADLCLADLCLVDPCLDDEDADGDADCPACRDVGFDAVVSSVWRRSRSVRTTLLPSIM